MFVLYKYVKQSIFDKKLVLLRILQRTLDLYRLQLFEKDCYKLLDNAFFGKTMENVKKRVKIELVNKGRSHVWQTSKPSFKIFFDLLIFLVYAQRCTTSCLVFVCRTIPLLVSRSVFEAGSWTMHFIGKSFRVQWCSLHQITPWRIFSSIKWPSDLITTQCTLWEMIWSW